MIYKPQTVRKRSAGKLAKTSYVNEVVDALPTRAPVFGQTDPDFYPAPPMALIRIDSNRTKGGDYKGYIQIPKDGPITVNTGTTFAGTDIGTDGEEVTLRNLNEEGKTTHAITAGTQVLKRCPAFTIWQRDESGHLVYYAAVRDGKQCVT